MAQETNILIQVSNDEATWTDLATLTKGTVSYIDAGLALGTTKYYRTIAKGDGVNTLDSEPSTVVNVASGFVAQYQTVLDYATTNSIGTPSFVQNVLNDNMVRNILSIGKWSKFDVFYYFLQEAGTPYEFMTLNWINPANHRLTNEGANPISFIGGSGMKAAGGNSQYFNMNWTPSIDAVNCIKADAGAIFSLFDVPTTYASVVRIASSDSASTDQLTFLQSEIGKIVTRLYQGDMQENAKLPITQSEINKHYHISDISGNSSRFINGSLSQSTTKTTTGVLSNITTHLFGTNYRGTPVPTPGALGLKYFALTGSLRFSDRELYQILNNQYLFKNKTKPSIQVFTAASSLLDSLYMAQVYRTDSIPAGTLLGITKKHFVVYSTDHGGYGDGNGNAGMAWGEMDHPNFSGFVEKGIMLLDNTTQPETPFYAYTPNDVNGHVNHLYYHTGWNDPRNPPNVQQTRLYTAPAGASLTDLTMWTDRGIILGLRTDLGVTENHTGYMIRDTKADASLIAIHVTRNNLSATASGIPKTGISTNNGIDYIWTRQVSEFDIVSFMPHFRQLHHTPYLYFMRNGIQYVVGGNTKFDFDFSQTRLAIARCDGNYKPVELIGNISQEGSGNGATNMSAYIDEANAPDTLNIYYTKPRTELFHTTWDLKNLD